MERIAQYSACLEAYSQNRLLRNVQYDNVTRSAQRFVSTKRDKEFLRPPKFNIFSVLGCIYSENAHSSLLAYFLNPSESHNQGTTFVRKFLDIVREAANKQSKNLTIPVPEDRRAWVCRKEMILPDALGRTDIMLRGPTFIAIIENKIRAIDQNQQLARYWKFVKSAREISDDSKVIIYLTLNGKAPTELSIGSAPQLYDDEINKHLVCISYYNDIYNILQEIYVEFIRNKSAVSISEILLQYMAMIRSLE